MNLDISNNPLTD